jgi:hypothetical protein
MKSNLKRNCRTEENNTSFEFGGFKMPKLNPIWVIVASIVIGMSVGIMINPLMNNKKVFAETPETLSFQELPSMAPPVVSICATKMNVVYRGVNNPIAIIGNIKGELRATASSGTLTQTGAGIYNLRPGEDNEVTISVSSQGSSLGSMKFRVKDMPKPTAIVRNAANCQVSKSALLAAGRVEVELKNFDFEDARYDIIGYTFIYKTKSGTIKEAKASNGNFTDEIKTAISQANAGDMFIITAVQVRGGDGKEKMLDSDIGLVIK